MLLLTHSMNGWEDLKNLFLINDKGKRDWHPCLKQKEKCKEKRKKRNMQKIKEQNKRA